MQSPEDAGAAPAPAAQPGSSNGQAGPAHDGPAYAPGPALVPADWPPKDADPDLAPAASPVLDVPDLASVQIADDRPGPAPAAWPQSAGPDEGLKYTLSGKLVEEGSGLIANVLAPAGALPDGIYLISTVMWPDYFLFQSAIPTAMNAVYTSQDADDASQWRLTNLEDGSFKLANVRWPGFTLALGASFDLFALAKGQRVWCEPTDDPAEGGRFRLMEVQRPENRVDVVAGGVFGITTKKEGRGVWLHVSRNHHRTLTLGSVLKTCRGEVECEDGPCAFIFQRLQAAEFSFQTSAYKKLLDAGPGAFHHSGRRREAMAPKDPGEFHTALDNTMRELSTVPGINMNPEFELRALLAGIDSTRTLLEREGMLPLGANPQEAVKFEAKLLWTSDILHKFGAWSYEFCWLLNWIIRLNDQDKLRPAMPIIMALNLHCAKDRKTPMREENWPETHMLYRGGGFNMAFKFFFKAGVEFRTTGFLATTPRLSIANTFMNRAKAPLEPIRWTFHIHKDNKCRHVNFMDSSMIVDQHGAVIEVEFLFSPFSAFKIRDVRWQEGEVTWLKPHEIELDVHPDNKLAPEDLPLAPWL